MTKTKKQSKPQRPSRDEFELEEIAYQLTEAMEEKTEVALSVWKEEEPVQGKIIKMDGQTKLIHVEEKYGSVKKVPFLNILAVSTAVTV
ncbi:YolD-like family protein [Pseudobacillus sp. FSL P4-0506]|uniref:YolD-like family protein n=1 Tax=Pseudobacillus sp. FSL P4-0506 TaxID=2921576 RepID=UPI0030FBAE91